VERRLPAGFPYSVWSRVAEGMRRHAAQFLRSAPCRCWLSIVEDPWGRTVRLSDPMLIS